jgi:hypothetical protein
MHPSKKKQLIERVLKIAREAEVPELGRSQPKSYHGEDGEFALHEVAFRDYVEVGESFLNEEDWGSKFSENYIYTALDGILAKVVQQPTEAAIEPLIDHLLRDLGSYSDELAIYFPISGLSMDIDSLDIGSITLRNATDEFLESLAARRDSIIYASQKTDPGKQYLGKHERARLERYKGRVFVEYHVIAEQERAVERAVAECRRVLDLLWLFVSFPDSRNSSRFHISIEEIRQLEMSVLCEKKFYSFKSRRRFLPFHLRGEIIGQMREMGIFEVGGLLKKPDRMLTDFEKTLIRGIHWYAAARAETESENEFLNLVVCLETFLTPANQDPIAAFIAQGVAIILAQEVSERLDIKKKVKKFYGMRSRISHGGRKAVTDSDLMWLREAAWYVTEWMIKSRTQFHSRGDLCDWIERKTLGEV